MDIGALHDFIIIFIIIINGVLCLDLFVLGKSIAKQK